MSVTPTKKEICLLKSKRITLWFSWEGVEFEADVFISWRKAGLPAPHPDFLPALSGGHRQKIKTQIINVSWHFISSLLIGYYALLQLFLDNPHISALECSHLCRDQPLCQVQSNDYWWLPFLSTNHFQAWNFHPDFGCNLKEVIFARIGYHSMHKKKYQKLVNSGSSEQAQICWLGVRIERGMSNDKSNSQQHRYRKVMRWLPC